MEQAFKIRRCQSAIALLQNDNISLQAQGKNLQEIVGEKEIYIEKFKKELSQVRQNATKRLKTTEDEIKKTYEYRYLSKIMVKGSIFSDEDWQVVNKILLEYLPGFYEFLATKSHLMNTTEYRTCMLVRLYFKPLDVANSLGISPSYVSKIRTNLLSSLFGIEGTGKQFDTELREID